MSSPEEKVLGRVDKEVWEWIESRTWHQGQYEIFKDIKLKKATKAARAMWLLYNWFKYLPRYTDRKGTRVTIEFENEDKAQVFCAMLSKESRKR